MLKTSGTQVQSNVAAGMRRCVCAAVLAVFATLLWSAAPASAAPVVHPTLVRTIDASRFVPYSSDPSGIVYRPSQDRLLIGDSEVDETGLYRGSNLFTATRTGSGFGSGTVLPFGSREPTGLALDTRNGTLYVSDDDQDRVSVIRPGRDGVHGNADDVVSRFSTSAFGSTDPEDVAYDKSRRHLFVCDGSGIEIYDVNPVNGTFGDGVDIVTHFDLARYGLRDCEGLGIDPRNNRLLAVDERTERIYELSRSGDLVRTLSLSAIRTRNQAVSDVTLAPTSNPNDSTSAMDYWITDRHLDNNSTSPPPIDGLIYEMR
jgi:DNA-binding beta-propeller fold protein YncE